MFDLLVLRWALQAIMCALYYISQNAFHVPKYFPEKNIYIKIKTKHKWMFVHFLLVKVNPFVFRFISTPQVMIHYASSLVFSVCVFPSFVFAFLSLNFGPSVPFGEMLGPSIQMVARQATSLSSPIYNTTPQPCTARLWIFHTCHLTWAHLRDVPVHSLALGNNMLHLHSSYPGV